MPLLNRKRPVLQAKCLRLRGGPVASSGEPGPLGSQLQAAERPPARAPGADLAARAPFRLAVLLADVLRSNPSLTLLNIESNSVSTGGVEALAAVLPQTQITYLKYAAAFTPQQSVNAH